MEDLVGGHGVLRRDLGDKGGGPKKQQWGGVSRWYTQSQTPSKYVHEKQEDTRPEDHRLF